ncbi:MAG: copper amine oxidase N-terminal domain-containing protein [Clostridiales bacterium]|nr:copper amine oxidase N-terminal domain-containing protein [Clostridiales bacterium]
MKKSPRILSSVLAVLLVLSMTISAGATVSKTIQVNPGITVYVDDSKLVPTDINGKIVDVFASDGTTYMPLRALSQALGKSVAWNADTRTVYVSGYSADDKNSDYLQTYFGISPFSGTVSRTDFDAALVKIGGKKTDGTGSLTVAEAVKAAVCAAGMEQLALTYTAPVNSDKVDERLAAYGVTGVSKTYASYVAAALDTGIALSTYDFSAALDATTASSLLMAAVNVSGHGRNYLGMASDPDIYSKLQSAWNSFTNFDDEKLTNLGAKLVIQGASTGYGLKYDGYNANFLPKYTLSYGHSDITHAIQLIGLLNSEGINAKVQMEPKVSIYEYMVEWGDPTKVQATPTYKLKQIDGGRWLCYAMEYDLKLEFDTVADKEAFHGIIENYAKKYDNRVDTNGKPTVPLLSGSWWQPLYSSTVKMENTSFKLLKDNVIRDGAYSIHPYSLPENSSKIAAVVASVAPDLKVESSDLYVDPAFYNYITGADHQ